MTSGDGSDGGWDPPPDKPAAPQPAVSGEIKKPAEAPIKHYPNLFVAPGPGDPPISAPVYAEEPAPAVHASEPVPAAPASEPAPAAPPSEPTLAAYSDEPVPAVYADAPAPIRDAYASEQVPSGYSENELRLAVGVEPRPEPKTKREKRRRAKTDAEDDDGADDAPRRPRSLRSMAVIAASIVFGLTIAVFVFLGRANSDRYAIACEPDLVVAQQGRSFPPWGLRALGGAEWKPIGIPPEAECRARETDDVNELTGWYLQLVIDQASTLLTAREVTKVDLAEQQLKQALLLARAPEHRDDRKEIERLLGDVGYWRASAKLRDAATALTDAAKQFDEAAAQRPRHVSDASAWSAYVRKLVDQLHAGPAGATPTTFPPLPTPERPAAPAGVALPVEPDRGSAAPATPPAPADAGAPTGGVLL